MYEVVVHGTFEVIGILRSQEQAATYAKRVRGMGIECVAHRALDGKYKDHVNEWCKY